MFATPKAEDQLIFIDNIQRLLSEGDFTATYKFALLTALADLSVEREPAADGTLTLEISEISEKFIDCYWGHTKPYYSENTTGILRQTTSRQAAIINRIADFQQQFTSNLYNAKRHTKWYKLLNDVSLIITTMPLWKLQTIGDSSAPLIFLYENAKGKVSDITLLPGVAHNFRHFHSLVTNLVRSAWVLQIHRIKQNQQHLGTHSDLAEFLFGSERSSLDIYRPLLTEIQEKSCFYCNKTIKDSGEVDHFVPWSRYPVDLGHNFVLAHKGCNSSKRDFLAATIHLDHWLERNIKYRQVLDEKFSDLRINSNWEISRRIAWWAYDQNEKASGLVWQKKNEFLTLDDSWRQLFR